MRFVHRLGLVIMLVVISSPHVSRLTLTPVEQVVIIVGQVAGALLILWPTRDEMNKLDL